MRWTLFLLAAGTLIASLAFAQARTATHAPDDAAQLQRQGIARIDRYVDQFRRTGDLASLKPELEQAERELTRSSQLSVAAGDFASAAYSRIKLGDIQRYQNRWDAAVTLYLAAQRDAVRAGHAGYQAKAFINQALAQMLAKQLDSAAASAEEAVRLSERAEPRTLRVEALTIKSEVASARGDQTSALQTIDRALNVAKPLDDRKLLMYAYQDRAEYLIERSNRCDYERVQDVCLKDLDRAKADYDEAIGQAVALGYGSLANQFRSFQSAVDIRRTLIEHHSGFLARLPTALQIVLSAKETNEGAPVSVTVVTINSRNEPVPVSDATPVTLESEHLTAVVHVTIPAGQSSVRAQIVFRRPGVARLKASASKFEEGYAAIAVKRRAAAAGSHVTPFHVRTVLTAFADRIAQLSVEVLPARVMPKEGVWSAKIFVSALDEHGEPVEVTEDLSVQLVATLGSVTPALVVIKRGSSTCTDDIRVTSTRRGSERVYAYSPRVARRFEKQIEYERPQPTSLLVHAAPSRVANSGRTPIEIMVILQDDHHNPATFADQPLPVVLTSTLGTLSQHEAIILKGTTAAGPFRLTSARAGSAQVTARVEGLPDSSVAVSFEFPWRLVVIAMLGGVTGAALRSRRITQQKHLWTNLMIGGLMGLVFFALTLLGVTGLIPSVSLPAIENLTLNEFGAFLLGLFGGYLGRRFLDKLLTPAGPRAAAATP